MRRERERDQEPYLSKDSGVFKIHPSFSPVISDRLSTAALLLPLAVV